MTVVFDNSRAPNGLTIEPTTSIPRTRVSSRVEATLDIGLLNNMPDPALQATERQFLRLLNSAADHGLIRLHFYSLPTVARSSEAKSRIEAFYGDIGDLGRRRLDGLIVTGTEPRAASLAQEPYWRTLTEVIDWAKTNTLSTIWSCLAAHGAVLHLDGIERRRLNEKRFGVFDCSKALDDRLVEGLSWPLKVAHARHNELRESDLVAHGYRVLTRSGEAGVDIFTKQWNSLFIFFQGHPEYDPQSLQREFLRDVNRFLTGGSDTHPPIPKGYFTTSTEKALQAFRDRAISERGLVQIAHLPDLVLRSNIVTEPTNTAMALFRNWLKYLFECNASTSSSLKSIPRRRQFLTHRPNFSR